MNNNDFAGLETDVAALLAGFAPDAVRQDFYDLVTRLTLALADGHSCLPLTARQAKIALASGCADASAALPLTMFAGNLYLTRYFRYEKQLAEQCLGRLAGDTSWQENTLFARLLPESDSGQRQAGVISLTKKLCLITGGPGVGKTATVVKIIALLLERFGLSIQIALCAPTGKAAMRLKESILSSLDSLPLPPEIVAAIPRQSFTLHRLLGARGRSPYFRHNHDNPLSYDVVVVDEASMVDLALMSKLADALKPSARLILLGDPHQLASVESGAVFAEMLAGLPRSRADLTKNYRFNPGIGELAQAIRQGDAEAAWAVLRDEKRPRAVLTARRDIDALIAARIATYLEVIGQFPAVGIAVVFAAFRRFQTLCATREGENGVAGVNERALRLLRRKGHAVGRNPWYSGRPVLLRRNDFSLGLYNGDIGICLSDESGEFMVWFEGDGGFRPLPPWRLPEHDTAWAMTIHKSQGSECAEVLLILPETDTPVLSRELLYTGVTRARDQIRLVINRETLRLALSRPVLRASGLAAFFSASPS
ncbi:MAG: exodeoxyribonuclease V subunit alpha [Desulfobulbaceae bacterium]|jgi:exodeoxyribonuclease V alpha subunit|nr:exodeoxyribonuclease V subunit alpha [Desulfobulbaceae bacterium]